MIERFRDRRRLLEALARQQLILADSALGEAVANAVELRQYDRSEMLVAQGQTDDHVCLVLAGSVEILVNGRVIAKRNAGEHVGEMALLNPDGRRSATVVAADDVVVACVSEKAFTAIANDHPVLWRRTASCLANRLSQRSQYVRPRNETPVMFIGSSAEALPIANAIQSALAHENAIVRVWTNGVFDASNYPMEDLERELTEADFGVLVLSADDRVVSRGEERESPRDNTVLELGLFLGAIGRKRTYIVTPRGYDIRIPSDLFGMTPLTYVPAEGRDLQARLGPVCTSLAEKIRELGPR